MAFALPLYFLSRKPVSSFPDDALSRKPEIMPACRAPARGVGMVARFCRDDRDENLLDRHPDRQLHVHLLDEPGIERLALDRIYLGRGVVDRSVHGGVFPAPLVGPGRALGLAGTIPDRCRDRRIVAVLMPAGGKVEGVLVIDLLQEAAAVIAHYVDGNADLRERSLDEGRPQRNVLAPRRWQQAERKVLPAGTRLVAGFVKQGDRLGLVVR